MEKTPTPQGPKPHVFPGSKAGPQFQQTTKGKRGKTAQKRAYIGQGFAISKKRSSEAGAAFLNRGG